MTLDFNNPSHCAFSLTAVKPHVSSSTEREMNGCAFFDFMLSYLIDQVFHSKMLKTIKVRLYPNKEQKQLLSQYERQLQILVELFP